LEGELLNGNYRVTKLLGEGTFGRVVEAQANGRKYAIKVILVFM
jgi:serine/threonine protein kinase